MGNEALGWSEEARMVLLNYGVLEHAVNRFWQEWRTVLEGTKTELEQDGFLAETEGSVSECWGMLQVARPHWPKPFQRAVHFEVWLNREWAQKGLVPLYLDIEDACPERDDVIEALSRTLMPYEKAGLLVAQTGCKIPPNRTYRLFEQSLALNDLSSGVLTAAVKRLGGISAAIDQAIFVRRGEPIWTTHFLPGEPLPKLQYGPGVGGQHITHDQGYLGSGVLHVDGSMEGNHNVVDGNPTHIMMLDHTTAIRPGEEIYMSCLVKAPHGGRLWFHGEERIVLTDGKQKWPCLCNWHEITVPARASWQHVACRITANASEDFDFSKHGAHLYLRTQTEDSDFRIAAVEIGHFV